MCARAHVDVRSSAGCHFHLSDASALFVGIDASGVRSGDYTATGLLADDTGVSWPVALMLVSMTSARNNNKTNGIGRRRRKVSGVPRVFCRPSLEQVRPWLHLSRQAGREFGRLTQADRINSSKKDHEAECLANGIPQLK